MLYVYSPSLGLCVCIHLRPQDWDQTRVYNNTVYLANSKLSVDLTGCESGGKSGVTITLAKVCQPVLVCV